MLLAAEVTARGTQVNGPVTGHGSSYKPFKLWADSAHDRNVQVGHGQNVQVGGRQSHAVPHASYHGSSSNEPGAGKPESRYPHISKQYPLISKRYPVRYPWDILLVSIRYSFISRYILLRYPNIRIFFASLKISHKYLRISVDIKVCENVRPQICGDFPRIYII